MTRSYARPGRPIKVYLKSGAFSFASSIALENIFVCKVSRARASFMARGEKTNCLLTNPETFKVLGVQLKI